MSENIAIEVGGRARNFTADKIRVQQQDSEALALLVPESSVPLDSLDADVNATYVAADQGLFGYDVVEVNVPGYAGGGGDTIIEPDEDGDLIERDLATSIRIRTLPAKLVYSDGETIDTFLMSVAAYGADGQPWELTNASGSEVKYFNGAIPDAEWSIDPTVADASKAEGGAVSNFEELQDCMPIPYASQVLSYWSYDSYGEKYPQYRGGPAGSVATCYWEDSANNRVHVVWATADYTASSFHFTHNGKTVAYGKRVLIGNSHASPQVTPNKSAYAEEIAWTMIYGTLVSGAQTITVSWPRYGDGKVLTTSFEITVQDDGFSGSSGKF